MFEQKEYEELVGVGERPQRYKSRNWMKRNSKYWIGGTTIFLLACIGFASFQKQALHNDAASLTAATDVLSFNNSYIQNVKSGKCITMTKDALLSPLAASDCNCGSYQFWRMQDGEHVINELAMHPYMDELFGYATNGATVGSYDLSGLNWQKWKLNPDNDGDYTFVDVQTKKCLQNDSKDKIVQWDCDPKDESQKWRIVENPCGKLSKLPTGHFQLENPATGMCAGIKDNSNIDWAKVVTAKCGCDNKYHYWTFKQRNLVSEGSARCMANWDALGHPGVTQCVCANDGIHDWRLAPLEDGNFNLVTAVDGKCVSVNGTSENADLQYHPCDRNNKNQIWGFHDACLPDIPTPPPQPNVIPANLVNYFKDGSMNWLTPARYHLLVGGHWDATTQIWYTADGKEVKPGTDEWTVYFGDAKPSFLTNLFQGGKSWNETFRWMTIDFFETWTSWKTSNTASTTQHKTVIPSNLVTFFSNGQMNWLTPSRCKLLVGGRWDSVNLVWHTADGKEIRPSTPEWTTYFGDLQPSDLTLIFKSAGSSNWNDAFGWITPTFFQEWTGSQPQERNYSIRVVISGNIPPATRQLFASGRVNWLTPDRLKMLKGGEWTGSEYITNTKVHVAPGTTTWKEYFGSADAADVNALFGGPGSWDTTFAWLNNAVIDVPTGMFQNSFPWNEFIGTKIEPYHYHTDFDNDWF